MDRRMLAALGLALALGTMQGLAAAGDAVYRSGARGGGPTYTDRPCQGGTVLGAQPVPAAGRRSVPPQDRAHRMKRAQLQPAVRQECERLDAQFVQQQAYLRTRGAAVTADDERPLVLARLRYQRLRC